MQQEIVLEQAHVEDERTYHSFGAKQEEGLPPSANLLLCIASRTTALFCTLVHYQARSTGTLPLSFGSKCQNPFNFCL